MINQRTLEERRTGATSIVLELLCTTLFFIHHDNDDEANWALINLQVEAAGRYSTEGKRLRARIDRTERELGGMVPYHTYFPEGFLAVLNSISTPDVALYLEKSCSFFPWWDAIDLQYCIDTTADGLEDTRWKKAPIERAASWARERLATLQDAILSAGTTAPEATLASSELPKKQATLCRLSAPEVRRLLTEQGLGRTYNKSGEWVAAFRALVTEGILIGNAPQVHRWGMNEIYVDDKAIHTIKKAWQDEKSEAAQFTIPIQRTVFKNVQKAIKIALKTK